MHTNVHRETPIGCPLSGKHPKRAYDFNGGANPTFIGLPSKPEHCCSGERGRVEAAALTGSIGRALGGGGGIVWLPTGAQSVTINAKRSPVAEMQTVPTRIIDAQPDYPDKASARPPSKPSKKSAQVIALLANDDGVSLAQLCAATDWEAHTCRAFLTGLRKKGRALERSHRADGASVYKLMAAEVASQ